MIYTLEHKDRVPVDGVGDTLLTGPVPFAGDVLAVGLPSGEVVRLTVTGVEHQCVLQPTGTYAVRVVVLVEVVQ